MITSLDSTEVRRILNATSGYQSRPAFKQPIPVFFHNLKGYDAHLLMSALGETTEKDIVYKNYKGEAKIFRDGKILCIAQNMEKLISFSYGQFRFVDSFAFLSTSLNTLVSSTPLEELRLTGDNG